MKTHRWITLLAIAFAGVAQAKPAESYPSEWRRVWDGKTLTAHEWGTFTSVQGSDGVVLDGLTHEDRDLPSFVYDLRDQNNVTGVSPKMETPVVYFYAPEKRRRVTCRVDFPRGAVTQWYPAARYVNHVGPQFNGVPAAPTGKVIDALEKGYIEWDFHILAPDADAPFPAVKAEDPWRFSRQVKANPLQVCHLNLARERAPNRRPKEMVFEHERCLFYRGLGHFALPFKGRITADASTHDLYEADIELSGASKSAPHLEHVFVVHVNGNRAGFAVMPLLKAYDDRIRIELDDKAIVTERLVEEMAKRLTRTGLFTDEAYAMARTWQHGWFQDEGTRVLYVFPRAFVDRELPLKINSRSMQTGKKESWDVVRTFVGRTELLSPREEETLKHTATDIAQGTPQQRAHAEQVLARWGRFAAPYLRRVLALTDDEAVRRSVFERLEAMQLKR